MIMKKAVISICVFIMMLFSASAVFASDSPIDSAPYLESVSFKNAEIDGGFALGKTGFDLILENPESSPIIDNYRVSGKANVFVTYSYDKANHQTGVQITLAFESGSIIYTFNYKNAMQYQITDNANLAAISCELGEVQPNITDGNTNYKLYIPSDLTQISITPITQDVNAYCAPVNIELNEKQEPEISLTVQASDGSTKNYKFKVKRVRKTTDEVRLLMQSEDYVSFAQGELLYRRPEFIIAVCSAVIGAAVLIIAAVLMKRVIVNPYDRDEKEFYLNEDNENS